MVQVGGYNCIIRKVQIFDTSTLSVTVVQSLGLRQVIRRTVTWVAMVRFPEESTRIALLSLPYRRSASGSNGLSVELDTYLHLFQRLRVCGSLPLSPHTPSVLLLRHSLLIRIVLSSSRFIFSEIKLLPEAFRTGNSQFTTRMI